MQREERTGESEDEMRNNAGEDGRCACLVHRYALSRRRLRHAEVTCAGLMHGDPAPGAAFSGAQLSFAVPDGA